ncbi:MAG: 4-oxalocrotonate tautomerase [Chloroflexota bacterium]|nr:MAG: 4-oxalocrotonate tautomerase [Chloroflexota bacterium]
MPYVIVEMFEGRSIDQKRACAQAITDAIVAHLKASPDSTHIIFHEMKRENHAHAGKLACD